MRTPPQRRSTRLRNPPARPGQAREAAATGPDGILDPPIPTPFDRGFMRVRKAVFPAAGWGTRFLPATKAQPKEMLPLVDKPIIQYAVEEAVAAGIEQVIIVTSSQKRAIEDHFDTSYELERLLEEKGDIEMLRQIRHISDLAQVTYVRQKEQLGLGHAVLVAKEIVGHEPFAVILSDDVVIGDRPCIGQLVHAYNETHGSIVAVMEVPDAETHRYGVIAGDEVEGALNHGRLHKLSRLVEKPTRGEAPSNLAIIGRYILTPKIFDKLEQTQRGAGGEIQLTDALEALMQEQAVYGYEFEGTRYDCGTTMGWLKASVELALQRPELAAELRPYLRALDL
jgi:UTP--glucose-1-phosphate uridylyltransferase